MDTSLAAFKEIAPYLTHPLVLVGFVLLLFFGLHRSILKESTKNRAHEPWKA
jgi:hypothetical protein